MFEQLKGIFVYNQMLISQVRKDLRARYRGSVLGFLWSFVNPLMQLVVYTFVFSRLMKTEGNYLMYVFTALLPWNFFASSLQNATTCIVQNAGLIKKIYFPRIVLPISAVTTNLMNFIFGLAVLFPALLITGEKLTVFVFLLPMVIISHYIFTVGLSLILSALYVYFRDLEHIVNIAVTMWFYLTPVLYDIKMFEGAALTALKFNPMLHFAAAYRDVLLYGKLPNMRMFCVVSVLAVLAFIIGAALFSKLQKDFAEQL
ncbi:MAG: ABC transporter permease [Oscillospiraceae bacterium]|jgi:ABC-2 type transport system permease protein|nr:ABC transporter permease [Oscillospiraceae bacterium]